MQKFFRMISNHQNSSCKPLTVLASRRICWSALSLLVESTCRAILFHAVPILLGKQRDTSDNLLSSYYEGGASPRPPRPRPKPPRLLGISVSQIRAIKTLNETKLTIEEQTRQGHHPPCPHQHHDVCSHPHGRHGHHHDHGHRSLSAHLAPRPSCHGAGHGIAVA